MNRIELHPFTLRAWHWVNTALILLLLITGARLRVPDLPILLSYRSAVLVHKLTGFAMTASFVFWLIYSLASGAFIRHYVFRLRDSYGMIEQIKFYAFGVFRGKPNPFHATPEQKFNALQKVAYASVMLVFTPVIVITGIFFSNIVFFKDIIDAMGGIRILDAVHLVVAYIFLDYVFVHVYMSTVGLTPFSHIKEMFTGYEQDHKDSQDG
jgi:thiosulfate reductase cytochrome b subunit